MRPRKAHQEDFAQVYYAAAQEHKTLSIDLYDAGRYAMAHYVAGLAVECILRAYRYRIDPVFDSRHDLQLLYAASGLSRVLSQESRESVVIALIEVARRWNNNHRYRSERALRDFLRQANLGGKGKFVKESSRRIVNAAIYVVEQGVLHWSN